MAAHIAVTDGGQRHIVPPGELQPEVAEVGIPDVDRRLWSPGQPEQQDPAVLVEPLQVPVTPVDDLRDEAVGAHIAL